MEQPNLQEHVLSASWYSIHGPPPQATEEDIRRGSFFKTNPNAQHAKKIKYLKALFAGDLNPVTGCDFSKAGSGGAERESRLRRWAEELWTLIHKQSQGSISDKRSGRPRDVLEEVLEEHGGQRENWCTRFGFFNTFRCPASAKSGQCVQTKDFGQQFLSLQTGWARETLLLREAEETARRVVDEERARVEAEARAAHVAPVVGQPVAGVAEVAPPKPAEQPVPEPVPEPDKSLHVQEVDTSDEEPTPPPDDRTVRAASPGPEDTDVGEQEDEAVPSMASRHRVVDDLLDEEEETDRPPVHMAPEKPPAPPRGPSPVEAAKPSEMQLPKSVVDAAADDANYGADTIDHVKKLWTMAQARGKKRQLEYDIHGMCDVYKYRGWTIRTHKRGLTKDGAEPKTLCDSYWHSPSGKKFRSAKEIDRAFQV
jgi:hypothetical protein